MAFEKNCLSPFFWYRLRRPKIWLLNLFIHQFLYSKWLMRLKILLKRSLCMAFKRKSPFFRCMHFRDLSYQFWTWINFSFKEVLLYSKRHLKKVYVSSLKKVIRVIFYWVIFYQPLPKLKLAYQIWTSVNFSVVNAGMA